MSVTLTTFPQVNTYYRQQYAAGGASQSSAQSQAAADPASAVGKTGTSSQSDGVKAKSDPNYVCQTCKQRRYQDQSNDPSVSFQSPGYIAPGSSAAVVMSHEQQHVSHEQVQAGQEGRRVVSQSVVLHYAVCPECHRSYVSGGETRTVTASANRSNSSNSTQNNSDTTSGNSNGAVAENSSSPKRLDIRV